MRYNFSHINFTSLTTLKQHTSTVWKIYGYWMAFAALTLIIIAAITNSWAILFGLFYIAIFSLVIFAIIDAIKKSPTNKANNLIINNFYASNNLNVINANLLLPDNVYFQKGDAHSQRLTKLINFNNRTEQGEFYYTVTTHDDDGSHTTHYREPFFRFKLTRKAPNILVDSANLISSPKNGAQKIQTESAEFNKKFKIYIPKNYHIDALQIFTPDVMACLLDHGSNFDYELIDDYLYFYMSRLDFTTLETTLATLSRIATQIDEQVDSYSDARIGHFTKNEIHVDGARIGKPKLSKTAIVIIIIVMALFVSLPLFFILRTSVSLFP